MSSWNYRVIRSRERSPLNKKEWLYSFGIHEAYYDDKGLIWTITEDSIGPHGETVKELKTDFAYFMQAFGKPVLDGWKLPQKGAKGPCRGHRCKNVKERKHGKRVR